MTVASCCGCCSVRTGAVIIGILHMIGCGVFLVLACIHPKEYRFIITLSIQVFLSILMLIGVSKRNDSYVFPYLCVFFANMIGVLPMTLTQKIQVGISLGFPAWYYVVVVLLAIFFFAILAYFYMVVYSFYQELLREKFDSSSFVEE